MTFVLVGYFVLAGLLPAEIHFVLTLGLVGTLLFAVRDVDFRDVWLIWPLVMIIVIGVVMSLFYGWQSPYDVVKILWHQSRPVLYFVAGYLILKAVPDLRTLFRVLLIAGLVLGLVYIARYALDPNVGSENRTYIRREIGKGWMVTAVAVAIVIAAHAQVRWNRMLEWGIGAIILLSIIISTGRSQLVNSFIFAIFMLGIVPRRAASTQLFAVAAIMLFIAFTPMLSYIFGEDNVRHWAYEAPIGGVQEVVALDYADLFSINNFWRGYETTQAFKYVNHSGLGAQLFGVGLGTLVPLGLNQNLGGQMFFEVPQFHNGFSHIVVRSGYVGVFLYLLFFVMIFRYARWWSGARDPDLRMYGRFATGMAVCAVLATAVIGGVYNKGETGVITMTILGGLMALPSLARAMQNAQRAAAERLREYAPGISPLRPRNNPRNFGPPRPHQPL